MNREGQVERTTKETSIKLSLRLTGEGSAKIGPHWGSSTVFRATVAGTAFLLLRVVELQLQLQLQQEL